MAHGVKQSRTFSYLWQKYFHVTWMLPNSLAGTKYRLTAQFHVLWFLDRSVEKDFLGFFFLLICSTIIQIKNGRTLWVQLPRGHARWELNHGDRKETASLPVCVYRIQNKMRR